MLKFNEQNISEKILNKMKKIISYCLFVLFVFSMQSCKKDPGGTFFAEPEPVFSVAATFGTSDILLEAGRENFYMFTSYDTDSLDVLTFKGEFKQLENCLSDCDVALSISLRDSKVYDASTSTSIDVSTLKSTGFGFVGTNNDTTGQTAYEIMFNNRSFSTEGGSSELLWEFPSSLNVEETEPEFTEIFEASTLADGITGSLTAEFGSCSSTFEKVISSDYQTDCYNEIDFNIVPKADGVNYQVLPVNSDFPNWQYSWDDSFVDTLTIASPGTYCLTVTNSNGCSSERCISISNLSQSPDSIEYCYAGFSYEVNPLATPGPIDAFDFSKILITYTDKDGVEYRSDLSSQPDNSFFIIESVEDYDFNEFQQPTVKLKASFKVILYNESTGEGVWLEDGEATFGIALPK